MSYEGRWGIASAAVLSLGLIVGGWVLGSGFARARSSDRYVTVKGVSEREVRADPAREAR